MSKNFRNFIDLTPWDSDGHSFWGLKREQAKFIALVLITFAILLANPPFIPSPDDVLNVIIAKHLITIFGVGQILALSLTYTLIPLMIFFVGITIYPYNTKSLFYSYMNRLRKIIKGLLADPKKLLILIIVGYFVIKLYSRFLI